MDFAENIVSNPVTIKLRREEESLGDELSKVAIFANSLVGLFCGRVGDTVVHCLEIWYTIIAQLFC